LPILPALYRRIRNGPKSASYNYNTSGYRDNSRRVKASQQSQGSTDVQLSEREPSRHSDYPNRPDAEWHIETGIAGQDRLYVPIARPSIKTPFSGHMVTPPRGSSKEGKHTGMTRPWRSPDWPTNTSYAGRGGNQRYGEESGDGGLGAGEIGVARTVQVDVSARQ
jgi:hypothetical protein